MSSDGAISSATVSTTSPSTPAPVSTRASSRKNRVYVLRQLLLDIYGTTHLSSGTILDVAGGKGDLSWLLVNADGLESVVVDPRRTQHDHLIKSVEFLRLHPEEAAIRAIPHRSTHQPLATLLPKLQGEMFERPRHLRLLVDGALVEAVQCVVESKKNQRDFLKAWEQYWTTASERALTAQTLGYQQEDIATEQQIVTPSEALDAILSARLLVGFHPDQATEACFDLAVVLGIPCCCVPCCVFPSEFPHRQNPDGQRVKFYEDFLVYLQHKHPNLRRTTLNFHKTKTARNVVLYTLPTDVIAKDT